MSDMVPFLAGAFALWIFAGAGVFAYIDSRMGGEFRKMYDQTPAGVLAFLIWPLFLIGWILRRK